MILLAFTTDPVNKDTYRNYKRRTGKGAISTLKTVKIAVQSVSVIASPYWLKYRQQWLKDLLEIERDLNAWPQDYVNHRVGNRTHPPRMVEGSNEPDWYDTLPYLP